MKKSEILLKQDRKLFHTADLAVLWSVTDSNLLLTTIKRYVKRGILFRICKGFYSTKRLKELDPVELGLAYVHKLGYLSTESVLVQEGIINQQPEQITLVSSVSKRFGLAGREFVVRKMKDQFLYNDIGIIDSGKYKKAGLERAVADMLYFNPRYNFDNRSLVDWDKVSQIQKEMKI